LLAVARAREEVEPEAEVRRASECEVEEPDGTARRTAAVEMAVRRAAAEEVTGVVTEVVRAAVVVTFVLLCGSGGDEYVRPGERRRLGAEADVRCGGSTCCCARGTACWRSMRAALTA
jgi:hypothetical protein